MDSCSIQNNVCRISTVGKVDYTRNSTFLQTLVSQGYLVSAITPGEVKGTALEGKIQHFPIGTITEYFWHGNALGSTLRAVFQRLANAIKIARILQTLRPAIIICSEPDAWALAVLARRLLGCKIVVDLQEFYEDRAMAAPKGTQSIVRKSIRSLMRTLSKRSDLIIHVSSERQEAYKFLHQSGIVISNYPRLRDFVNVQTSRDPRADGRLMLLHAGALRPSYASDELLEALDYASAEEPRLRLMVLGGAVGMLNTRRISCLIKRGILEIKEQVSRAEVARYMSQSDLGISLYLPIDTAHRLAAPQKFFEYMGAGLPVLASDVPTLRRVVTQHNCGILVDPTSPKSIASGLLQFVRGLPTAQVMGENGRRKFMEEFNWEQQEGVLCEAIEGLASCTK